jgi:hypothetical protein
VDVVIWYGAVLSWQMLSQRYPEITLRLADFILDQNEAILQEWDKFARTVEPSASSMTIKELRNHAAEMLKCVANDLRTTQSRQEEINKSHGNEPRTLQTKAGEEHGLARLDSRFTIEQLASEYRALRSSVLRLWTEANSTPSSTDIADIIRFNEAIDQLLAASIFSFAKATREALEAEKNRKTSFLRCWPMNCAIRFRRLVQRLRYSKWPKATIRLSPTPAISSQGK